MNISNIIQHLFKQSSLDDVSVAELQSFADEQPYFAVGHFLLLKKLQLTNDRDYDAQFQKTAIFFENPLWLRELLVKQKSTMVITAIDRDAEAPQAVTAFEIPQPTEAGNIVQAGNDLTTESISEQPAPASWESTVHQVEHSENLLEPVTVELSPEPATSEPFAGAVEEPIIENHQQSEFAEATPSNTDAAPDNSEEGIDQTLLTDVEEAPAQEKGRIEEQEMPIFQSFHTIDYFASQGIKVSQQIESQDKLGTQLRSFTEWLKTMKRLPPTSLEKEFSDTNTEAVEEMAAHSIEEKEIITETMAEVLTKQGKTTRALDIYRKLSLLNPSKSAYFASKIEDLKNKP